MKIVGPCLPAVTHLLIAVQVRNGLVITLYRPPLIIRLSLLPLVICLISLINVAAAVGIYIVAAGSVDLSRTSALSDVGACILSCNIQIERGFLGL